MTGAFVTFEGVEGAGKSTAIASAAAAAEALGKQVLTTREPGATELGRQLRQLLLHRDGRIASRAELFLYLADRAQHLDEIVKPALARGAIVLCDRFTDSTIAYQGYGRGLPLASVRAACSFAQDVIVDRTYLLDVDPQIGLTRARSRGGDADRLEREHIDFHKRIRDGFLALATAEPQRVVVVDASRPETVVAEDIRRDLNDWLTRRG